MIRNLIAALLATFALTAFAAVDVNKASQAELETVKGIGPGLSSKILDARKTGSFKSWADMVDRVGGVGPGNAARFSQAGLTVAGAPFDASTVAAAPAKPAKAAKTEK
jgi:competence protein ComEA